MNKWINNNDLIRNMIDKYHFKLRNTSRDVFEETIKFNELIEELKTENYNLYKIIIGLFFCDTILLLKYRDLYNQLNEEEVSLLKQYESISNIEELIFIIEQDPSVLYAISGSSTKFNALNKNGKSVRLSIADEKFMSNFSIPSCIEKESYFEDITLEELTKEYKTFISKNKNLYSDQEIENGASFNFKQEVINRSYGNMKNFENLIIRMLKIVYKWKRRNLDKNYLYFLDIDSDIINLVETKSREEIIEIITCDNQLLNYLIGEYLVFINDKTDEYEKEINNHFDKEVCIDVKIKLKEV